MEFDQWWLEHSQEHRQRYVAMGAFGMKAAAKAAWDYGEAENAALRALLGEVLPYLAREGLRQGEWIRQKGGDPAYDVGWQNINLKIAKIRAILGTEDS